MRRSPPEGFPEEVKHMNIRRIVAPAALIAAALTLAVWSSLAHEGEHHSPGGNGQPNNAPLTAMAAVPCVNGMAGTFPCNKVDLAALLPIADIDGTSATNVTTNDIWGWTDTQTGKEYALLGMSNSISFVDVTVPEQPVYLGNLPTHTVDSLWRGLKVYRDHLYVISEAAGHGMQVFDLRQLRNVASPTTFAETAHYNNFGSAHTIAVNEETGYLYVAGSRPTAGRTPNVDTCPGATQTRGGGLHMIDVRTPGTPAFAGCVNQDGYTHETQCVIYRGPDAQYGGHEICFSSNEDTLTIVDVTNKAAPAQLSRTPYAGSGYTHQGWLTDDHARFLLDDELDEQNQKVNTRTFVWNVADLDAPSVQNIYNGPTTSIDHNLYIRGLFAFESNYRSGVRVLDVKNVGTGALSELAFFDVYPTDDQALFNGTWANYPYFASGTVIASGMEQGLFVLRPKVNLPIYIDYSPFFVRQHYLDFFGREPDAPGLAFWTHQIASCMADVGCTEVRRINVSGAFFLSIEFQETGFLVYRMYKAAYGDLAGIPVPLTRAEFVPDAAKIGQNVQVGAPGWEQQIENNKNAFASEFTARQRFTDLYPQSMTAEQFVDALNNNTADEHSTIGVLSPAERNALVADLQSGAKTRAQVLRAVAEDADLKAQEKSPAFVTMQYFGYMRRDPDKAGFDFWLTKLNNHGGDYVSAEMVKAFITSPEYRARFQTN
jgi:choice-of-anchor B domain-containing protein